MESVLALLVLVVLSLLGGSPAAARAKPDGELASARVARASGSCGSHRDCAWGFACDEGMCVEAECHDARRVHGRTLDARVCLPGLVCAYDGASARAHGAGQCDAP
jgi:hypothetical protein